MMKMIVKISTLMLNHQYKNDDENSGNDSSYVYDLNDEEDITKNYKSIPISDISNIKTNTKICYMNNKDKIIYNKYFKSYDVVILAYNAYDNNTQNKKYKNNIYNLPIRILHINITTRTCQGGTDDPKLKDTIEIKEDNWNSIIPDTVISYKKKAGDIIYLAKFNDYIIRKKDRSIRFTLSASTGSTYFANPTNMAKIYSHITSKDKTLIQILNKLALLEKRIASFFRTKIKVINLFFYSCGRNLFLIL